MRICVFLFSKNPLNSLINSDLERALECAPVWLEHETQLAGAQDRRLQIINAKFASIFMTQPSTARAGTQIKLMQI